MLEGSRTARVLGAIDYMRRFRAAPLDLARLARVAEMSRFHFLRVFRETTGITPARFLASLRIERAKQLLVRSARPVTSICLDVGYNSLGTFSHIFRELVGTSPSDFRTLAKQLSTETVEAWMAGYLSRARSDGDGIAGSTLAPTGFAGIVFVGLFASRIPQGRPVSGAVVPHTGRFVLSHQPRMGPHHLLAIGLPFPAQPSLYLLPRHDEILVAHARGPAREDSSRAISLALRPPGPLDPPILTALPLLVRPAAATAISEKRRHRRAS